ncbi:MAG TPA: iron ABC transporter permease [Clostridiales bacterium]|nr:iron ABC transporter permease [Clostridiales bacterium]
MASASNKKTRELYEEAMGRKKLWLLMLLLTAITIAMLTLNAGASNLSMAKVGAALLGSGETKDIMVVQNIRLPRVLAGFVAGTGLALAGCIMQNNLSNPLASPSTLGISNAAAFGANVAIIVFGGGSVVNSGLGQVVINNPYIVTLTALFFALLAVALILGLSLIRRFSPESVILAGVAISSLFAAGTMIIQYFAADSTQVAAVIFWTFGDLGRASWREIAIMAVTVIVSFLYFMVRRWDYNALDGGEDVAKSLGVHTKQVRLGGMFMAALIAAVTVSFLGIIGFIGLVAPQITKRLIGNDKRYLIPASALVGAIILLGSDTLARTVISPQVLPVGAVTSFLGAPLFLYLLMRKGGVKG